MKTSKFASEINLPLVVSNKKTSEKIHNNNSAETTTSKKYMQISLETLTHKL